MINPRRRALATTFSLLAGGLMVSATWHASAADDPSDNELRIGLIASLTGPVAPFGIPQREAVEFLAKQANESGGINGRKVVVFVKDDKTNPTEAAKVARDLMQEDKVQVILGPTTGSGALAVAPLAARNKVPVIAPVGTIPFTAQDSGFFKWVFRSTRNNSEETAEVFQYIKEKGYKSIGLFFQQDAYGEAGANYLKKLSSGDPSVKIISEASAPLSATDLSVQATKILSENPDIIFAQASSSSAGGALMRALQQARATVPVIVSPGMTIPVFIDNAAGAAEGVFSIGGVGWDRPSTEQSRFIQAYGEPKNFGEANAGTAFMAVAAAARKVNEKLTGSTLRDALEQTCPFPTLYKGDGCYSAQDHDGNFKAAAMRVVNGKWVTIDK